jgi:hypothetical protein
MALEPGTPIVDISIDRGVHRSCTNARIEDPPRRRRGRRRDGASPTVSAPWSFPGRRA